MPVPVSIKTAAMATLLAPALFAIACDSVREQPVLSCVSDEQCPANGFWRCNTDTKLCEKCVGSCASDASGDASVDGSADAGSDAELPDAATADGDAGSTGPDLTPIYTMSFDCDTSPPDGWAFSGHKAGDPGWAVDATPAKPGAAEGCSLNFNEGTGFVCPNAVKLEGTATSPSIDASAVTKGQTLLATFKLAGTWSNVADTGNNTLDGLQVQASADDKTWTNVAVWPSPGLNWTDAQADLTAYSGAKLRLRFRFYATDCKEKSGTGPFIDDLVVRAGSCVEAPDCDDGNDCTYDACDATNGLCTHAGTLTGSDPSGSDTVSTDGKDCDDGKVCTINDTCANGQCKPGAIDPCTDDNSCSIDTCIAGTGCTHVLAGDGVGCDDLNGCTGPDVCAKGVCVSQPVANGTGCDDGQVCTIDVCVDGKCTSKDADNGTDCAPGKPCHVGLCVSAKCVAQMMPNGTDCDDDETCTNSSQCVDGVCEGTPDPDKIDKLCDDGNKCTEVGTCSKAGACVAQAIDCDDSKVCTTDSCDPKTGNCKHVGNPGGSCDDAIACTANDTCNSANLCVGQTIEEGGACDNGKPCYISTCIGGKCEGKIDTELDGKTCDDNDKCTNNDVCVNGTCESGVLGCDDLDPCTFDACLGATTLAAECTHVALNEGDSCDDGDACTPTSTCTAGKCGGTNKCSQTVTLMTDNFDCGGGNSWTFAGQVDGGPAWAVDATPADPAPKSAGCSLNFNDGKDFDNEKNVSGSATSLTISLPAGGVPVIRFWSWHETQPDDNHDKRSVLVSSDGFKSIILGKVLPNGDDAGKWVQQEINLPALAGKTIQVRFAFDSIDNKLNSGRGWFVDDLVVQAAILKN